jgi:predicted transcriptional regulator
VRIIEHNYDFKNNPKVGDIVYFINYEHNIQQYGIVVQLSIEEHIIDIISEDNKSYEEVAEEFICLTIVSTQGTVCITKEDIISYHPTKH